MLLTIDVGNTQIVSGVFDGQTLRSSWRLSTEHTKTADEYGIIFASLTRESGIKAKDIHGTIISSVVPPLTPTIESMIETFFQHSPLIVSSDFPFGLTLEYANPQEIGTDRLVNAAAAFASYRTHLIIVDFGTATTFCTVTKDGRYLGGAIAPGIKSAAEALHHHTAKLPNVELTRPKSVIGTDTDKQHPIRFDLRLCGTGRCHGHQNRTGNRSLDQGRRHRRACPDSCANLEDSPRNQAVAHAGGSGIALPPQNQPIGARPMGVPA